MKATLSCLALTIGVFNRAGCVSQKSVEQPASQPSMRSTASPGHLVTGLPIMDAFLAEDISGHFGPSGTGDIAVFSPASRNLDQLRLEDVQLIVRHLENVDSVKNTFSLKPKLFEP